MVSGASAQIRLVRCPRCLNILPESPGVLVYKCGGCGTRLRGECSSNQNNGRDQIESSYCNGDKLTGLYLPNEDGNNVSNQNGYEDFDSEQLEDENLSNAGQKSGSDKNESGICDNEQDKVVNLSDEDQNNGSHQNESTACNIEQHGVSNEDCSSNEPSHLENGKLPKSPLSGTNSEVDVNDESLLLAAKRKVETEADANNESDSSMRRSSHGEPVDIKGSTSIATAQQPAKESISFDVFLSSPNELLEQPQESANHGSDCVMSTDAFENTDFFTPSSELSDSLIDLSKSPTTRSSRAYYDDGVSSYEGTDDQLPDRHKHSSKHAYRSAASDVRPRRERFLINSNRETHHHFRNSASILPERTRYAMKSSKLDRDELLEPTRLGHSGRNWRRLARHEYLSQPSFHGGDSLAGYESGSPSNHNEFYYNSSFPAQDKPLYAEQEKMKLLRMVYHELQDQLNKTSLNDKTNGVTWKDDYFRMNYGREVLQEEGFHNLIYPRFPGKLREDSNWSQLKKHSRSRMPFSAEATTSRHQVDHSFCCSPQEWQCTAQFPRPGLRHNKGFGRVHSHLGLYNSYGSCPSSPQWHVESQFPIHSRGTKSDEQRYRNNEVKRYSREKHHLAKRRVMPIAGAAPFITCYCCLKQLQLPVDFLLFKRRCHQLKCGACSKVLKFSLQDRTHLIPCMPSAEAPPPSEADECSDAIHQGNFTSTSHVSGPCADCVSCSDDCGRSFCKSCSTDRNSISLKPFHAIHSNDVQRNVPHVSLENIEDRRKFALNEARNKGKYPVQTYESAGPSSSTSKSKKVSSEIEELPAAGGRGRGPPLQRLMGYYSPSEMMYGWRPSVPATTSYHPEM
ncbi:protein ENHANCED DISEASE RESISTANCE 4 isoform X2 [Hevea brasiliensis]|uniref:protein ENHANCED DISEASE RESISTANCE 4 isoform X2 n=1 Tax=Hevea brasiliensis TaxID=3981 RepID=UPI0025D891F3|nr:protein ENHANCED DISEASE RESISTANCE 4 isoform X2 [Hevea brasiliensis]